MTLIRVEILPLSCNHSSYLLAIATFIQTQMDGVSSTFFQQQLQNIKSYSPLVAFPTRCKLLLFPVLHTTVLLNRCDRVYCTSVFVCNARLHALYLATSDKQHILLWCLFVFPFCWCNEPHSDVSTGPACIKDAVLLWLRLTGWGLPLVLHLNEG